MRFLKPVKKSLGFALLEVLIAIVVLAFGMMGMARMLMLTHKSNSSSYLKQQAVQSAYDILDRIRTNSQAAIGGSYNVNNLTSGGAPVRPSTTPVDCSNIVCDATQLAAYDIWNWQVNNLGQLPNGSGAVATSPAPTGGNTVVSVTVQWDDSPAQRSLGAASQTQVNQPGLAQFTVQTLL